MDEEEAIRDFLGDRPDSAQLNNWRVTLEDRLKALEEEWKRSGETAPGLKNKIQALKKQIAALQEEEAVTQFVEDSVRVTLAMGRVADPVDEEA
jgi:phage shock protein A